jgi:hypothetical protein
MEAMHALPGVHFEPGVSAPSPLEILSYARSTREPEEKVIKIKYKIKNKDKNKDKNKHKHASGGIRTRSSS